jgi:hypothetical protein
MIDFNRSFYVYKIYSIKVNNLSKQIAEQLISSVQMGYRRIIPLG